MTRSCPVQEETRALLRYSFSLWITTIHLKWIVVPKENPKWAWIQSAGHPFGPTKVSSLLVSKNPCWDVDNVDPYPTLNNIDIENPSFIVYRDLPAKNMSFPHLSLVSAGIDVKGLYLTCRGHQDQDYQRVS